MEWENPGCHTRENKAFRKWWNSWIHGDIVDYNKKKKESDRIIGEEKKKEWDEFTEKLSEDIEGSKMFYKIMKNKKRSMDRVKNMESTNGKVLENGENYGGEKLLNTGSRQERRYKN